MINHQILTIAEHWQQLKMKSLPVACFDDKLRRLVSEMFEVMYAAPGIGLAAVQIGIHQRIVVLDVSDKKKNEAPDRKVLFNPQLVWKSDETNVHEEGCLSIPEFYEEVKRPASVRVSYQDEYGRFAEVEASGILATCLQHEIDHLDGKLFIDHISKLKRDMVVRRFKKAARLGLPRPIVKDSEPSHHIG